MGTDLICGRLQLSHQMHHIFFPLSQKVDTTSNFVIGEGVNVTASMAQCRRTIHGRESISSAGLSTYNSQLM